MLNEKSKKIEDVRVFCARLSTDVKFREEFLDDPVKILGELGYTFPLEDNNRIEETVSQVKNDIRRVFEITSGSFLTLEKFGLGVKMPPEVKIDDVDIISRIETI